jgi:MoxR-like ATPase
MSSPNTEPLRRLHDSIETVFIGKQEAVEMVVVALLASGHLLIEDVPGVGKTVLAQALAKSVDCHFQRIQFTPDLLPSDIVGVSIYENKAGDFTFKPGPIFGNVILADEINRATPKAQASLLECMEEGQITVDGITHRLPQPFFIIATENPIEYHGTYPLPEGQLDRFLLRLELGYPSHEQEVAVMERQIKQHPIETVGPVLSTEEVVELQGAIRDVYLEKSLKNYIVQVVEATRHHAGILLGASPRGSLGLMRAAQATAAMAGRDYVLPDDIKRLAPAILSHRLILRPETKVRGIRPADLIREILEETPVPTEL